MSGPSEIPIGTDLREFPGRSFNLLVRDWYRNHATLGRDSKGAGGPGQFIVVKARNVTGDDLNYGACVAIEGLAIPYADKEGQQYQRPLLKAQLNSSSLKHSTMGIALTPVADNQPGPFIIAGIAWIRCVVTDRNHHFAKLPANQSEAIAESGTSGHAILDSEELPEDEEDFPVEVWALVERGGGGGVGSGGEPRRARVSERIEAATNALSGGSGTVDLSPYGGPSDVAVTNGWPIVFPVDAMVRLEPDSDTIHDGMCVPAPAGFWDAPP